MLRRGCKCRASLSGTSQELLNSSISIPKYTLITLPSHRAAAECIATSKWASRGWTFQESALSSRILIFDGDFVYFRCQERLCASNGGFPPPIPHYRSQWFDLPILRLSQDLTTNRPYPEPYSRGVTAYLRRRLTKEEDMLNAFVGYLDHFDAQLGGHQWGLSTREFGVALQWSSYSRWPLRRRSGFPSWSWTGWFYADHVDTQDCISEDIYHARVSGGESGVAVDFHNHSVLTCFKIAEDGSLQCFDDRPALPDLP